MRRRLFIPIWISGVLSCGGRHKPTETERVRVAVITGLTEMFSVYLADALGYFKEQQLSITIDEYPNGTKVVESLLGGSSDIACSDYVNPLLMAVQGRQLRTFVLTTTAPQPVLVVSPGKAGRIRRIEDLKGAVVGVAGFGSLHHRLLQYLASAHGVPFAEIRMISYGSGPAAIASLQHDKVDAGMINGSAFNILKRRVPGIRVLIDTRTREGMREVYGVEAVAGVGLYATAQWIARHKDTARRLAVAMVRTLHWTRAHSAEEVRARLPKFRTDDKDADLETLRDLTSSLSPDGRMPVGGAEAVYKVVSVSYEQLRTARIDLSQTYTNEFVADIR